MNVKQRLKFYLLVVISTVLLIGCNNDYKHNDVCNKSLENSTKNIEIKQENLFVNIFDGGQVNLKIPDGFKENKWIQTCGPSLMLEKQNNEYVFNAPILRKDTKFCYSFLSEFAKKRNISINVTSKKIEIYIDHASLPTLQQLVKIIKKNKEEHGNKRIISWQRISIKKEQLSQINGIFIGGRQSVLMNGILREIRTEAEKYNRIELELNTNTSHSYNNLMPILKLSKDYNNIKIKSIDLYDDGSLEYVDLYNFSKNIASQNSYLSDLINKSYEIDNYINTSGNMPTSIVRQEIDALPNISIDSIASAYSWHRFYPTVYHFLRSDYLDKNINLEDFKTFLGNAVQQMKWDQYSFFNKEQKMLFEKITGFNPSQMEKLYTDDKSPDFIFTGTAAWGKKEKGFYAQEQVNVIRNAILDSGDFYLGKKHNVFFKGHPNQKVKSINDEILTSIADIKNISANISLEVLQMTGMLAKGGVGGMASSLYFTIPQSKVRFIVFSSSKYIHSKDDLLNTPLVQIMLQLNIVEKENLYFWNDLKRCNQYYCV